jgi:hypothetical protein
MSSPGVGIACSRDQAERRAIGHLQDALTAALMLTGTAEGAERAVWESIGTLDESAGGDLFHATLRTAVAAAKTQRDQSVDVSGWTLTSLPNELRRVLSLRANLRHCFVLRILLGLPLNECADLLETDESTVAENTVSAAVALAAVRPQKLDDS